jgi:hypothetical protein
MTRYCRACATFPLRAQARCYPGGVPGQLLWPFEPVYFIQNPKEVWMIWQRDHLVRRIYLTDKHSEHVTPSWFGESIGHYENGDTLVVDTVGLSTGISYIDNFRTPHSEKLHVVERFTIERGGKGMSALVTVEDPDTFNAPLTMTRRWSAPRTTAISSTRTCFLSLRQKRPTSELTSSLSVRLSRSSRSSCFHCDLRHAHLSSAALSSARLRSQRSVAMSGERRLSREGDCKPSFPAFRLSEMNFGLIAMLLLATLAIIVTLMFPEIQLQPSDLLVGP